MKGTVCNFGNKYTSTKLFCAISKHMANGAIFRLFFIENSSMIKYKIL